MGCRGRAETALTSAVSAHVDACDRVVHAPHRWFHLPLTRALISSCAASGSIPNRGQSCRSSAWWCEGCETFGLSFLGDPFSCSCTRGLLLALAESRDPPSSDCCEPRHCSRVRLPTNGQEERKFGRAEHEGSLPWLLSFGEGRKWLSWGSTPPSKRPCSWATCPFGSRVSLHCPTRRPCC
jgi:hypothetical protein